MLRVDTISDNVLFDEIARATEMQLNISGDGIIELDIISEAEIHEINRAMRGVDKPTDVLSFPLIDTVEPFDKAHYPYDYDCDRGGVVIGNILICREIAERQAKEYGHSVRREMAYLFLHGLLHCLGYDHVEEDDRVIMRDIEEKILTSLGVVRQ